MDWDGAGIHTDSEEGGGRDRMLVLTPKPCPIAGVIALINPDKEEQNRLVRTYGRQSENVKELT